MRYTEKSRSACLALLCLAFVGLLPRLAADVALNQATWRSELYPEDWTPPSDKSFTTDKLIQDFSYAGYRRGEEPVPHIAGPIFDVTLPPFNADPTGQTDSTSAIQKAIDAAEATPGGGVVFLPAGTYLVAPKAGSSTALRIKKSNIVLRGAGVRETFLLNTSITRSPCVIWIAPPSDLSHGPYVNIGTVLDSPTILDSPTRRIPVSDAAAFHVGDQVRLVWSFTQRWIDEHDQAHIWTAPNQAPTVAQYHREVTAVNPCEGWIELDVPTRYTINSLDNARLRTMVGNLRGVGLEHFSIGNLEHPGNVKGDPTSGFGDVDYNETGTAARDMNGSWLINIEDTCDSWITSVHSFQAPERPNPAPGTLSNDEVSDFEKRLRAGNSISTAHMLSNGIRLYRCFRMTLDDCAMRRPQYGGGGGNGYMFRIQSSQEILVKNSVASFSRHGFMLSHAGTSGNVFLNCLDEETKRATGNRGAEGYVTEGSGSDHHQHFSHSNLFDSCRVMNSFYAAMHRGNAGGEGRRAHGLTSAHGVYWNTHGSGTRGNEAVKEAIVLTGQARYGYVIGTSGPRYKVHASTNDTVLPLDHVDGVNRGATLEPQSLYEDQLDRRLAELFTPPAIPNEADTTGIAPVSFTLAGAPTAASDFTAAWSTPPEQVSIPPLADTFIERGAETSSRNYGRSTVLNLKKAANITTQRILLKFPLCNIDSFKTATLRLTKTTAADFTGWNVEVFSGTTKTGWTENWATWNNTPSLDELKTTGVTYNPDTKLVDSIDLTSLVRNAKAAGSNSIDLILIVKSQPDNTVLSYHSREHTDPKLRPRLDFELPPSAPRFENWVAIQPGVAPHLQAPMADADGDGLPNLLEMALGRDPAIPDRTPPLAWHEGSLHFTFSEQAPAFTRLQLEQSTDLVTWVPVNLLPEHLESGSSGLQHVRRPVPLDEARLFWRLHLIQE